MPEMNAQSPLAQLLGSVDFSFSNDNFTFQTRKKDDMIRTSLEKLLGSDVNANVQPTSESTVTIPGTDVSGVGSPALGAGAGGGAIQGFGGFGGPRGMGAAQAGGLAQLLQGAQGGMRF